MVGSAAKLHSSEPTRYSSCVARLQQRAHNTRPPSDKPYRASGDRCFGKLA